MDQVAAITHKSLYEKAVQAALAAIEIFNKPDFRYREENFVILMSNAWELLLKAKVMLDHSDQLEAITEMRKVRDEVTGEVKWVPKTNRSGNQLTVGALFIGDKLVQAKVDGFSRDCLLNLQLLFELRDNSVHFVAASEEMNRTVYEVGAAAVQNFVSASSKWFGIDYSKYHFALLPLAFLISPVPAVAVAIPGGTAQAARVLDFIKMVSAQADPASPHRVLVELRATIVKGPKTDATTVFRPTDDPSAPAMRVEEENWFIGKLSSQALGEKARELFDELKMNPKYYRVKREIEADRRLCRKRLLDPNNPSSGCKVMFHPDALQVFEKHYKRKP